MYDLIKRNGTESSYNLIKEEAMRKIIALLASVYIVVHLGACTSSDHKEDEATDGSEISSENVDGELEKVEGTDTAKSSDEANAGFLDEQLPEQELGESKPADKPADQIADAAQPPPTNELDSFASEPVPPDALPAEVTQAGNPEGFNSAPPVEAPPPAVDTGSETTIAKTEEPMSAPPVEEAPKPPPASLKKVEPIPYSKGGVLLNTVYIARPGDTYKKVSSMIYGSGDKVSELKKINDGVKVKAGAKIYYNSPLRPQDDSKVLTYYEDTGVAPEVYIAKEGDDLKKVSKKLLGFSDAWKEIWPTNSVEEKGRLTAGTELRYWKGASALPEKTTEVASSDPTPVPPMDTAMNNPPPASDLPPPPPDLPPPPPDATMAGTTGSDLPPPPPSMTDAATPPPPVADAPPPPPPADVAPPPPPMAKKATKTAGADPATDAFAMDDNMMMSLAGVAVAIAAAVAFIIVRKKKQQQKEMQAVFGDTQVGT